jgi:hypothetical protein
MMKLISLSLENVLRILLSRINRQSSLGMCSTIRVMRTYSVTSKLPLNVLNDIVLVIGP